MDERVKGEYRKIYSELVCLILVFSAVALMVKFHLYGMELKDCLTEFLILVGFPVYLAVRQYMLGLDANAGTTKKKRWISFGAALLVASAAMAVAQISRKGTIDGRFFGEVFTFAAAFSLVYLGSRRLGRYFSEKRAKKYED